MVGVCAGAERGAAAIEAGMAWVDVAKRNGIVARILIREGTTGLRVW